MDLWAAFYMSGLHATLAGVLTALVLGKSVGISLASQLDGRKNRAGRIARGDKLRHLIGTAYLAGIGFTMALFINGLAFTGSHFEREAQLAILIESMLAAAIGMAILLTTKATQV